MPAKNEIWFAIPGGGPNPPQRPAPTPTRPEPRPTPPTNPPTRPDTIPLGNPGTIKGDPPGLR